MTVFVAAVVGFLAGRLVWLLLRPTFAVEFVLRQNYRGHVLPTAAGVVLPLALLAVEAGRSLFDAITVTRVSTVVVAVGMGLLGLLDDLVGEGDAGARGFRGHVTALARGRLTTGGAKLLGGVAVALVAVAPLSGPAVGRLLLDGALVALAGNLGNLFDRGPGRTGKLGVTCFVALAVAVAGDPALTGVAVVVGAAAAILLDDLHERLMLGDTGANVLGGVLGLGVVAACAPSTRTMVLTVVVVLNLVSEVVSFSRVIGAVPPLRFLDRLGRRS
jgi:UDP-N-acetylmuramyl pentapeptide phosphotransferase/UDP-N-acetylglucosamine-1-phosphate transferase